MERLKLQIELNNHPYKNDLLYVAISLRGGYVTRDFILDETYHFISNCAFYNILFNYYRMVDELVGLHYDIQRAVSTICFYKKKDDLIPALNSVLQTIFNHEYNLEVFENAKRNAKKAFTIRYKNGAFRSKYKGFEFSDLNKCFTLKRLINDIQNITFEEFVKSAKALLVPSNVCIYISGNTDRLEFSSITFENYDEQVASTVRIAGIGFNPYFRQDAHITNIARDDHNLIIECFDFLNPEITNFAKQLIVEIYAELIPIHEVDVWVDSLDSSIMFFSDHLRSYKELLIIDSNITFNNVHENLMKKYATLLENSPEHFVIKAANLMTVGIYVDQYLNFLNSCSYEMFKEICKKADYKITEAQIVLRKELR